MSAPLQPPTRAPQHDHGDGLIAGRFEVVRLLGDGSFATVYEAIDRDLGRRVALKLFTSFAKDELEAALREARAMARLNHENVLAVHDIGEHRGSPFLAIEYAQMDLRRWLAGGKRDLDSILHLFCAAGRGLEAAHRAGLVHHDFKPANVLLRANGTVAVGDFGLARHLDTGDGEPAPEPEEGQSYALGTLRYIAPERLRGLPGDERSDQFSFCVALWEALAGQHPFTGSDAQRRLDSIGGGPSGAPKAPAHVVRALRRGLNVDPYERFETMTDLLGALAEPGCHRTFRRLRRSARPLATATLLVSVFALSITLSREAPALDVSITPTEVLTVDAALEKARDAAFDGEFLRAATIASNTVPLIMSTDPDQQREYVAELEVLGDILARQRGYHEAAAAYAMAIAVANKLMLDDTRLENKLGHVHARAMTQSATATRDK